MEERPFVLVAGLGCGALILVLALAIGVLLFFFQPLRVPLGIQPTGVEQVVQATAEPLPTLTVGPIREAPATTEATRQPRLDLDGFTTLYEQANGGAVNIQVFVNQAGQTGFGAGSGFILDEQGHIITNNHVVAQANLVSVIFYDGTEAEAEVVGTDEDSDLAVIRVEGLVQGAHPLPLGDSDQVEIGEWVTAIGNPFGRQSSMTVGIVSAVGRTIPTGVTIFSIPGAIQTDAAVNPGNSGGPLLNLQGEVVGVNAQIASSTGASAGVGFAIPSNIVRRVAPVLIDQGSYQWPWLGVEGRDVNLAIAEVNGLPDQQGAYIDSVRSDGPAEQAGMQGSTGTQSLNGVETPVGGDVVIRAGQTPISNFNDLLAEVAFSRPGDRMQLTVLRAGDQIQVEVQLEARP